MLVRRDGGDWKQPAVTSYSNEKELQGLIEGAPNLLPGGTGPLAIAREIPVSSGYIDIVGVEPSGRVVICECKLDANADSRRKVVGQLLAYAGALWELDLDEFAARFSEGSTEPLFDAVREIAEEDWDEEEFRRGLASCLETGSFRLIVAVDSITDELKHTLRFLNEHSMQDVEVLALEVDYTRDGDLEIIVPQSYGEEMTEPHRRRGRWDEAGLLRALRDQCSDQGFRAIAELMEFLMAKAARVSWGAGLHPSSTIYMRVDGIEQPVFVVYSYIEGAFLAVNFVHMVDRGASSERLAGLAERIRALNSAALERLAELEASGFRKRPGLPINDVVAADGAVDGIKQIVEWLELPLSMGAPKGSMNDDAHD